MPRLLYVGQNPGLGTGSPIIILRHLERLAAHGWEIRILADYGGDYEVCREHGWSIHRLCHRRWWWPPYRPNGPGLLWMRLRLLAMEAAAAVGPAPDVILSHLASYEDFTARLAAQVAHVTGAPLHFIVHDDAAAFPDAAGRERVLRRAHGRILRAATTSWFATPELADCYPTLPSRRVLLPIPQGWAEPAAWRPAFAQTPRVYYAGYVWPQQLAMLGRIARVLRAEDVQLVVMTKKTPELEALCETEPLQWRAPFRTNREALAHLASDAAGLLVSYAETVDAMPWVATSFPSKLIEYSHLGLPIAVVAPPDSAVTNWAHRAHFPSAFLPQDAAALATWARELREPQTWERHASASLQLARTAFSPDEIHRQLEDSLLPLSRRRAA